MKISRKSILTLRFLTLALGFVLTACAAAFVIENVRGDRAWQQLKVQYAARGESLDLADLAKPETPDALNLFKAPVWADWISYSGSAQKGATTPPALSRIVSLSSFQRAPLDLASVREEMTRVGLIKSSASASDGDAVLTGMLPLAALLDEIRLATAERSLGSGGLPSLGGNLDVQALFNVARAFTYRSQAEIATGRAAEGFADAIAALRIGLACESDPATLLQVLVSTAIAGNVPDCLRQACARHVWNSEQLSALHQAFARLRLVSKTETALRLERGWGLRILDQLPTLPVEEKQQLDWVGLRIPGWVQQNKVTLCMASETTLAAVSALGTSEYPRRQARLEEYEEQLRWQKSPYSHINRTIGARFGGIIASLAREMDQLSLAETAIALERYFIIEGEYPTVLAALTPLYLSKVPLLSHGEPINYMRSSDARGFNLQGQVSSSKPAEPISWIQVAR